MDIREHTNQVKEGYEAEWRRRLDREEGGLVYLKANVFKNYKRKLERS